MTALLNFLDINFYLIGSLTIVRLHCNFAQKFLIPSCNGEQAKIEYQVVDKCLAIIKDKNLSTSHITNQNKP